MFSLSPPVLSGNFDLKRPTGDSAWVWCVDGRWLATACNARKEDWKTDMALPTPPYLLRLRLGAIICLLPANGTRPCEELAGSIAYKSLLACLSLAGPCAHHGSRSHGSRSRRRAAPSYLWLLSRVHPSFSPAHSRFPSMHTTTTTSLSFCVCCSTDCRSLPPTRLSRVGPTAWVRTGLLKLRWACPRTRRPPRTPEARRSSGSGTCQLRRQRW